MRMKMGHTAVSDTKPNPCSVWEFQINISCGRIKNGVINSENVMFASEINYKIPLTLWKHWDRQSNVDISFNQKTNGPVNTNLTFGPGLSTKVILKENPLDLNFCFKHKSTVSKVNCFLNHFEIEFPIQTHML